MTFGCYIIMVCAYGFQKKAFVAVDVLYARLKTARAEHPAPDYLSGVLCSVRIRARARELRIFPSLVYHGERGYSVWAPPAWPVKLALFVGMTLLALQGISEMLKCVNGISRVRNRRGRHEGRRRGMMEMLTNLVTQSGVGATQLSAILLGVLFLIMIIGLATGQELAFVLGGAGVVIGYLAWGGPGHHDRHDQGLRPDAELFHGRDPDVRTHG